MLWLLEMFFTMSASVQDSCLAQHLSVSGKMYGVSMAAA